MCEGDVLTMAARLDDKLLLQKAVIVEAEVNVAQDGCDVI